VGNLKYSVHALTTRHGSITLRKIKLNCKYLSISVDFNYHVSKTLSGLSSWTDVHNFWHTVLWHDWATGRPSGL